MVSTREIPAATEVRNQPATDALPPSPWYVDPDYRPGMEWNNHILSADSNTVCFMAHSPDDNTKLENAANLIAAAPELLEALRPFADMDFLIIGGGSEAVIAMCDRARDALNKAEGK